MDERLEKAIEFSNYMVTLNNQKRLLKEKFYEDLIFFYNGCQFTVTRELINFCNTMIASEQEDIIIVDDNDIPSQVLDIQEFYDGIIDTYFSASNTYFAEYESLKTTIELRRLIELLMMKLYY
jgi:hypothetical protein